MKKGILLYHPKSSKGKAGSKANFFQKEWQKRLDIPLVLQPFLSLSDLRQKIRSFHLQKSILVLMGGDGTISEGLDEIFHIYNFDNIDFPIGLLPAGSGNSFLEEFGLAKFKDAVQDLLIAIQQNDYLSVDAGFLKFESPISTKAGSGIYSGQVHQKVVINIWGIGFVSYVARMAMKMRFVGKWNYTLATILHVFFFHKPKYCTMILDDGREFTEKLDFLTVSNSKFTGGKMKMAPYINVNDGKMFLVRVRLFRKLKILSFFPKIFFGSHLKLTGVDGMFLHKKIRFTDAKEYLMLVDGEVVLGKNPQINIKSQCWKMFLSKEKHP